jgi:F-type H+-transporting ATPase subunit beta
MVTLEAAIAGCERIMQDEFAEHPEQALYMIGSLDDIGR